MFRARNHLFINDLLSSTSNLVDSFADDAALQCSLSCRTLCHANINIDRDRNATTVPLNFNYEQTSLGFRNPTDFSALKTSVLPLNIIRSLLLNFDSTSLSSVLSRLSLFITSLGWFCFISASLSCCAQLVFYFAPDVFTLAQLLHKTQIRPAYEYRSHT